ncbi:hypothetical protein FXN61_02250 [Lentzea sp. PSKA42]|jgi:hypothetical protein|uniref:Secreted protein n=1 Tax=Lentzea indica TaxID=2604800 RepID=A0ABX1F9W8_9PSEU|nr:hypothetical protein [Lentzea indica]NKE55705.1 hypothetical protein [Lentzea indica]
MKKSLAFVAACLMSASALATAPAAQAANEDCVFQLDNPHASHHVRGTTNAAATIRCNNEKNYMGITIELFTHTPVAQRVGFAENGNPSGSAKFFRLNASWGQCRNGMVMSAHAKYAVVDKNEQSTLLEKDSGRVTVSNCP